MSAPDSDRARLRTIAVRAMRERGLEPDFSRQALDEVSALSGPPTKSEEATRDLRSLLWCSIDNDDSRDLDQLSVMEVLKDGDVKIMVAIADVDAAVPKGTAVDHHAGQNTTSVYTPAVIFPMLPERLSTDLTSLADQQDRLSLVIEFVVSTDGAIKASDVYGAVVRNRAKLAYNAIGAWLEGRGPLSPAAATVAGMDEQLRVQDRVAQALSKVRHAQGALDFQTMEVRHVFEGDKLHELTPETPNRAKSLIENLMVAANGITARFLDAHTFPSLRRVVRTPKRWDRIQALASLTGDRLPDTPDALALNTFLQKRRAAEPDKFTDLSGTVIRLLGSGEYVADPPGGEPPGHFGLAVKDYSHSTAPNRRYPDLLTQRLLKAALAGHPAPYELDALKQLASRCTLQEDNAEKVERQVRKSAAALLVESRVGQLFDGVVTGASDKGTYVRVTAPPIEGKVVTNDHGLDVGDPARVRLVSVNVERGYIDFERI